VCGGRRPRKKERCGRDAQANYASVRGPTGTATTTSRSEFLLQDVVKDADGNLTLKTVATIVKDSQESSTQVPMKW